MYAYESQPGVILIIFLFAFFINFLLSLAVASAAQKKGRSFGAFFFISFLFSFIIAAIVVASIAPTEVKSKNSVSRPCPFCDEAISANAILCKHCGQAIEAVEVNKHGDVLNSFLSKEDWINRFQPSSGQSPKIHGIDSESQISKSDQYNIWSQFLDEDGLYLLNGYYPSTFSDALQGWYICEGPWMRGSRFVVDL